MRGLFLPVEFRRRFVSQSVCLLVTTVYYGKTADWIDMQMPFLMLGSVGTRNDVLQMVDSRSPMVKGKFFGK